LQTHVVTFDILMQQHNYKMPYIRILQNIVWKLNFCTKRMSSKNCYQWLHKHLCSALVFTYITIKYIQCVYCKHLQPHVCLKTNALAT